MSELVSALSENQWVCPPFDGRPPAKNNDIWKPEQVCCWEAESKIQIQFLFLCAAL